MPVNVCIVSYPGLFSLNSKSHYNNVLFSLHFPSDSLKITGCSMMRVEAKH